MPSPPKGKRVRTNDHPGLVGKQGRRSKAEMAAEKAAKAAKATIATTTEKRVLTELAELELEQVKMDTTRREAVIRRQPAAKVSTGTPDEDSLQAEMDTGEDLTGLIDEEMEAFVDDNDGSESSNEGDDESAAREMIKKVSYTNLKSSVTGHSLYIPFHRSQKSKKERCWQRSQPGRRTFNSRKRLRQKSGESHA
jgi:hypothetical protein